MVINDADVSKVAQAAREVPPARGHYIEVDFVMNLLATVIDYQQNTTTVGRALGHFKEHRWDEIRTGSDLRALFSRFPDDQAGNTELAQHLWGYNLWTRAKQLRDLTTYFENIGVVDQESLRRWGKQSSFEADFRGRVKGLGIAIYHWLVMRLGVDTVKPDVHVRRFAEEAVGRPLGDEDVVEVVTRAALDVPAGTERCGSRAFQAWDHAPLPGDRSNQPHIPVQRRELRPDPGGVAVDRVFEGLKEMGWTRETHYDEEFVAEKHRQLREAGWTVITTASPLERELAQKLVLMEHASDEL